MSFSGRTPESFLPRTDSKNPSTTCKGLTASGRPCRRALASSPTGNSSRSSPGPSSDRNDAVVGGVLAILEHSDAAAFYCWQHKSQAEELAAEPEQKTTLFPLRGKSSIDSIAEKVGVVDLDSEVGSHSGGKRHNARRDEPRLTKRDTMPSGWQHMQGPLMTVPEEVQLPSRKDDYLGGRSNTKVSWSCCLQADDHDEPPQRHRRRPQPPPAQGYESPAPMQAAMARPAPVVQRKPVPSSQVRGRAVPAPDRRSPSIWTEPRLSAQRPATSASHTQDLLALIPSRTSPQTAALLLSELSKPLSPSDDSGYIYIFWLTPDSFDSKPDDETASSLLGDDDEEMDLDSDSETEPTTAQATRRRSGPGAPIKQKNPRQAAAIQRYASVRRIEPRTSRTKHTASTIAPTTEEQRTILLKIGRASNVHRRMTQWSKQCGQDITLVRFYPYRIKYASPKPATGARSAPRSPSGASSAAASTGITLKCPYISRVERLIHLELAEQRIVDPGKCEQCGREHKEWFEVPATRKGLRRVDEVVKRWVGWLCAKSRKNHGRLARRQAKIWP
ncbi:uncharacterized protein AB675_9661 [Cyphellophora attinorum]|uniref:Bacteriophage T5 Orf172 DNA-binding domain-containing protein n=1 Tax=Cyphellophora attinorum TaxID=1664694 RepID=A0A0N0NPC2_9EURO|nr:uncharacterized protein AB675_9661 [Phialophora attinorum]KPI42369.1 hypothetical protein AB675_9661 [Phialophora attinorum]